MAHVVGSLPKCDVCGHSWKPKKPNPLRCASCKSPYWNAKVKEKVVK